MSKYDTLLLQAAQGKILFRVWDDASPSPLIWTGDGDTSGFKCTHPTIGLYTPDQYAKATINLSLRDCDTNRYLGDSLLYHTMYTNRQHFKAELEDPYFQDRLTPLHKIPTGLGPNVWIHAYGSFETAINRMNSILAERPKATVHLTIMKRVTGGRESWTEVIPHLLKAYRGRNDRRVKKLIQKAIDRGREGADHVFYGRIFPDIILEDFVWTRSVSPLSRKDVELMVDPKKPHSIYRLAYQLVKCLQRQNLLGSSLIKHIC